MNYLFSGILGKSFLIQSTKTLLIVFFILFSLDFLLQIISEIEDLNKNYSFFSALNYLALIIVGRFCEILALCCVVSSVLTFGLLSDSGELTAARVLGMSLFSIVINILKPIVFFLFLSLFLLEFITPSLEKKALYIKYGNTIVSEDTKWVVKNDSFAKFKNDEDFLEDVTFYHFDQEKNLEEIIISEKVTVSDEGWKFTNPKNIKNNSNLTTYIWEEGRE